MASSYETKIALLRSPLWSHSEDPFMTTASPEMATQTEAQENALPQLESSSDEHAVIVSRRAELEFHGDIDSFTQNWTHQEKQVSRRLVLFQRWFDGDNKIHIQCSPVRSHQNSTQGLTMSCIYNPLEKACHCTLWEFLELLRHVFWFKRLANEEKGRIRRNLDSLKPRTVGKKEDFYRIVSQLPERPFGMDKAFKILAWSNLRPALCKLASMYNVAQRPGMPPTMSRRHPVSSSSESLTPPEKKTSEKRRRNTVKADQRPRRQDRQRPRRRQIKHHEPIATDGNVEITKIHESPVPVAGEVSQQDWSGHSTEQTWSFNAESPWNYHESAIPVAEEVSQQPWSNHNIEQNWEFDAGLLPNQTGHKYILPLGADDTPSPSLDDWFAHELDAAQRTLHNDESGPSHQGCTSTDRGSFVMHLGNHSVMNSQDVAAAYPPAEALEYPQFAAFHSSSLDMQRVDPEMYPTMANSNFEMSGHFDHSNMTQWPGQPDYSNLDPYGYNDEPRYYTHHDPGGVLMMMPSPTTGHQLERPDRRLGPISFPSTGGAQLPRDLLQASEQMQPYWTWAGN